MAIVMMEITMKNVTTMAEIVVHPMTWDGMIIVQVVNAKMVVDQQIQQIQPIQQFLQIHPTIVVFFRIGQKMAFVMMIITMKDVTTMAELVVHPMSWDGMIIV